MTTAYIINMQYTPHYFSDLPRNAVDQAMESLYYTCRKFVPINIDERAKFVLNIHFVDERFGEQQLIARSGL